MTRADGRADVELRSVTFERDYTEMADGSWFWSRSGGPRCCARRASTTTCPRWMRGSGKGWVTAEYSMLPGSSPERADRGRQGQAERAHRGDPAPHRATRAARPHPPRRAPGRRRLRRAAGRRRHAHGGHLRRVPGAPRRFARPRRGARRPPAALVLPRSASASSAASRARPPTPRTAPPTST